MCGTMHSFFKIILLCITTEVITFVFKAVVAATYTFDVTVVNTVSMFWDTQKQWKTQDRAHKTQDKKVAHTAWSSGACKKVLNDFAKFVPIWVDTAREVCKKTAVLFYTLP